MQQLRLYIKEYELDDRGLQKEEFIVALDDQKIVGFGRLREHSDCTELCSLGVITPLRRKGIGRKIVAELISKAKKELYLVCIIPDYFIPFGFTKVEDYPSSIQNKKDFCTSELCVPEKYCAMKYS